MAVAVAVRQVVAALAPLLVHWSAAHSMSLVYGRPVPGWPQSIRPLAALSILALAAGVVGCPPPVTDPLLDWPVADASPRDAASSGPDAAPIDTGVATDASRPADAAVPTDASFADAASTDTGATDAAILEVAVASDATGLDAAILEVAVLDVAFPDAKVPHPDASMVDAGPIDAGMPYDAPDFTLPDSNPSSLTHGQMRSVAGTTGKVLIIYFVSFT